MSIKVAASNKSFQRRLVIALLIPIVAELMVSTGLAESVQDHHSTMRCTTADTASDADTDFNNLSLDKITYGQTSSCGSSCGCQNLSLNLEVFPEDSSLVVGETFALTTTLNFSTTSTQPFTVHIRQDIEPSDGIELSPQLFEEKLTVHGDFATPLRQQITSLTPGTYHITTTAESLESDDSAQVKSTVVVLETQPPAMILNTPGSIPHALAPKTSTNVTFTVQVNGFDPENPPRIVLNQTDVATFLPLNDAGKDGDVSANDGVFSGITTVDTINMLPEDCLSFQAIDIVNTNETVKSATYDLCVTGFPTELQPSDLTNLVIDPESGEPAVANEVLVGIADGTSEARIKEIAASVNGEIIGSIKLLGTYQIRLFTSLSEKKLGDILAALRDFPEVQNAEANVLLSLFSADPRNKSFAKMQTKLVEKIRADEAWFVARGKRATVAVIDTGVDKDHPDLKDNLKLSQQGECTARPGCECRNFSPDPTDPERKKVNPTDIDDVLGHGTHVAGIVEGLAPDSVIIPIRFARVPIADISNPALRDKVDATTAQAANAIQHAASCNNAIINISWGRKWGSPEVSESSELCRAVTNAAKNALVVAGAGNYGTNEPIYPAACKNAIAVSNTTLDDQRYLGDIRRKNASSFGETWVKLAAPGTDISSSWKDGGQKAQTGTSMSAAMVSGAAALLKSRQPAISVADMKERLKRTVKKLNPPIVEWGRIDVFEAVFNGSFEDDRQFRTANDDVPPRLNPSLWVEQVFKGSAEIKQQLGNVIKIPDRENMASLPDLIEEGDFFILSPLDQSFEVQPDVSELPISFDFALVTDYFPEYLDIEERIKVGLQVWLYGPNGEQIFLGSASLSNSDFKGLGGGIKLSDDTTVGWTDWQSIGKTVPVTPGKWNFSIVLQDFDSSTKHSLGLIDGIRFTTTPIQ